MRKEKIIVANTGEDSLSIIDTKNDYKIEKIYFNSFPLGPYGIYANHKMDKIYTTNSYNNSVSKINLAKNKVVDLLAVGSCPTCIKGYNDLILISNSDSNSISIINEYYFKLMENISVGEKPNDIEIDKGTGKIYVANSNGHSIEVIDLEKNNIERISLKSNPIKIQLEKDFLYILSIKNEKYYNKSNLLILDLKSHKIIKTLDLIGIFNYMIKLKNKSIIFLSNIENGYLYIINIEKGKIIDKIYIGGMPNRILSNENNFLYITNINKNILSKVNYKERKVIKTINVGIEPNDLVFI